MSQTSLISQTASSADYELLDSGDGEKLERFGKIVLSRPDPQALWHKALAPEVWQTASGEYKRNEEGGSVAEERRGEWNMKKDTPAVWPIEFGGLKFNIRPTSFKHVGLFPEQSPNWDWLREKVSGAVAKNPDVEVLNLFGYTGGATLACAQAGAKMVHIDGSKSAIAWARENAELSGLATKPVRWILDDARAFVRREVKRGRKYDGVIMDPPAFGHGPDNELWKIEDDLPVLLDECMKILKDEPSFFLVNGYSAGYSPLAYENNLLPLKQKFGGSIETGELAIAEKSGRLLPAGIFARWSSK